MMTADPGPPILIYMLAGLILSLGLFLLIIAWYGKRIDDHPWCRKCRFDLFGRDKDAKQACPECGADLTKPKATRIGQRRKRRGLLAISSIVLLIGLLGLGTTAYTHTAGINWQHHKPVWWLMSEANQPPGQISNNALSELVRRYDTGELDAKEIDKIIEAALKHQANSSRTWQRAWGYFVEIGRQNGQTTDEQWTRYAEGIIAAPHSLVVRPKVLIGTDTIAVELQDRDVRMGDTGNHSFWLQFRDTTISVGPIVKHQYKGPQGGSRIDSSVNTSSRTNYLTMSDEDWATIGTGTNKVVFEYEIALYEDDSQASDVSLALANKMLRLEASLEVVESSESLVEVIIDDAYRQQVESAVRLGRLRCYKANPSSTNHYIDLYLHIDNRAFTIPGSTGKQKIDLACDIILRHEGKEYIINSMAFPALTKSTALGTLGTVDIDLSGQTVDIILRPSVEKAAGSVDCYEIWGEEIVFKDVEVEVNQ